MGFFSGLGNALGSVGRFARRAAPLVGLIPGVGTLAAAGIGAAGGLLGGEGLGGAARGALGGALGGLAGGGLSALSNRPNAAPGGASGDSGDSGGGGGGGFFGGLGGALGSVGNFARNNPELLLGGLGALQNARQQSRFEGQQREGLGFARNQLQNQQAIQQMMMERLQDRGQGQEDFGQRAAAAFDDPGNPFFRRS